MRDTQVQGCAIYGRRTPASSCGDCRLCIQKQQSIFCPPLVSDAIFLAYAPSLEMGRDGTIHWSCVKRKPSVSTGRNSPPFVVLWREQCPIVRDNGRVIAATLLCRRRQAKDDQHEYPARISA